MRTPQSYMLPIRSLVAWWALFFWTALARAQGSSGILVDASWSMHGFFAEKSIYELYGKIDEAIEGPQYAYFFKYYRAGRGGQNGLVPYSDREPADGGITLIDRGYQEMLERHPELGAIWLLTSPSWVAFLAMAPLW